MNEMTVIRMKIHRFNFYLFLNNMIWPILMSASQTLVSPGEIHLLGPLSSSSGWPLCFRITFTVPGMIIVNSWRKKLWKYLYEFLRNFYGMKYGANFFIQLSVSTLLLITNYLSTCFPVQSGFGIRIAGWGTFPSQVGRYMSRSIISAQSMNTSLLVIMRTAQRVSCTMPITGLLAWGVISCLKISPIFEERVLVKKGKLRELSRTISYFISPRIEPTSGP